MRRMRDAAAADVLESTRAHGMKEHPMRRRSWLTRGALALATTVLALPAHAQWTPVPEIPARPLFSLFVNGDTLATGADTTVHVSTDGGATWRHSTKPVA